MTPVTPHNPSQSARLGRRRGAALALSSVALAVTLVLPACGSDKDDASSKDAPTTTVHEDHDTTTTVKDEVAKGTITVEGADYAFRDLPAKVEVGTKLNFVNVSKDEVHELVAIKLPDSEKRPVDELMKLSEEELQKQFGDAMPATVLVAEPESDKAIPAVGDGTLNEKGRYVVFCSIPTGADPAEIMKQMQSQQGPPESDAEPHLAHGMFAEVEVV